MNGGGRGERCPAPARSPTHRHHPDPKEKSNGFRNEIVNLGLPTAKDSSSRPTRASMLVPYPCVRDEHPAPMQTVALLESLLKGIR